MTANPPPPSPDPHPDPRAPASTTLPDGAATLALPAAPGGPRRWWGEATSTRGGRAALVAAGALSAVVLLVGVALLGGLVGRVLGAGHHDGMGFTRPGGPMPGWYSDGPGREGRVHGPRQRLDRESRDGGGTGTPGGDRQRRQTGPGTGGLGGDVLHGEFTSARKGTPSVFVVQTGEVTAYTSGRRVTVRSSDGFSATYALDGSVTPAGKVARLATGVHVRVVAAKEGMRVTRLVVVPSP